MGLRREASVLSPLHGLPPWTQVAQERGAGGDSDIFARFDEWIPHKCSHDTGPNVSTGSRSRTFRNHHGRLPGDRVGLWLGHWLVLDHIASGQGTCTELVPCIFHLLAEKLMLNSACLDNVLGTGIDRPNQALVN